MKNIYNYSLAIIIILSAVLHSCETVELENLTSPNGLSPNQADPNLLLNSVQLNYLSAITIFNNSSGDLSRIGQFRGGNYFTALDPATLNTPWQNLYSEMIPDIDNIQALHDNPNLGFDLSFHLGVSKIMKAHILMLMVDFLGDVVYSQANNPTEFPTPSLDDDQDVYNEAIALLNEAKEHLTNASVSGAMDLFYDGDTDKWIKLLNTIKMRANLTVGNYQAVANATNIIENPDDDFEFKYGTNKLSPDTRHPDYSFNYKSTGAHIYQSLWFMHFMVGDFGDFSEDTDPRRRYYFLRQVWRTPGNYALFEDVLGLFGPAGEVYMSQGDIDGQTLPCTLGQVPLDIQFTPEEAYYCSLPLGYWGRGHGNGGGIPPDNFSRTAVGVYPAGGAFDWRADAFPYIGESIEASYSQQVGLGIGGGGAGIEPIYLASYTHFMKAEAELKLGNTAAAATHLEAGLSKSITKVMSFGVLDANADFSQAPNEETVAAFITMIVNQFNNANTVTALDGLGFPIEKDKMDILGEQYFVALFGGAADAFNFIRRTGYPRTLARSGPNSGPFPRTLLYPRIEVSPNPNIQQRTDLNTKVFWDQGVINPAN